MDYIWNGLFICILGIPLVGCTSSPYVKPTISWEKDLSESSKPSVKTKVEVGTVFK